MFIYDATIYSSYFFMIIGLQYTDCIADYLMEYLVNMWYHKLSKV